MLAAYRNKRYQILLIFLACILSFSHLAISEYFIGLEFIRPLLLGLVFAQTSSLSLNRSSWRIWAREIFQNWLPYLVTLMVYLVYRLVFFHSGRPATDSTAILQQIKAAPLAEISLRVAAALTDPVDAILLAWIQPLDRFLATYITSPRIWWGCMGIFAAVTLLAWAFFLLLKKPESGTNPVSLKWNSQALLLGLSAIGFAGLPLWGIGREVVLGNLNDRYIFPFIFGSALILASGILGVAKKTSARYIIASFVIGLSVGFHLWNTYLVFYTDWSSQRSFYSQLSWRAPGLQKGTSIWIVKDPAIMAIEGDYGLAMPVNWIYGPDQHTAEVNYWAYPLTEEFVNRLTIFRPGADAILKRPLRNIVFTGKPELTLVAWFAPPNCLKVVDPNQPELFPVLSIPTIALPLAHIEPIVFSPAQAQFPVNIFGNQQKDWCYYFEQADLARQTKDWPKVVSLGETAAQQGLKPSHDSEWLPFLEADVELERYDEASELITQIKGGQLPTSKILICGFIERVKNNPGTQNSLSRNEFLEKVSNENDCSKP
jgi:hypothetical protein